jgi:hypothetical protein
MLAMLLLRASDGRAQRSSPDSTKIHTLCHSFTILSLPPPPSRMRIRHACISSSTLRLLSFSRRSPRYPMAAGGGAGHPGSGTLERSLVKVLRHTATSDGVAVRPDGYASLDDVLRVPVCAKFRATLREVQEAVRASNKQRLALLEEGGRVLIRANQGHTLRELDDASLLVRIVSAAVRSDPSLRPFSSSPT